MDDKGVSQSILNIRNLVILAIFGLMIWFVVIVHPIIGIFLFSMIMAFLLYPPVESLQRRKLPRWLAIVVVYLIVFLVIGLIVFLVVPPLVSQAQGLVDNLLGVGGQESFSEKLNEWIANLENAINTRFGSNIQIKELAIANQDTINSYLVDIFNRTKDFVFGVGSFVTLLVSIPVICFYLLMDWSKIKTSLLKFLPPHIKDSTTNLMDRLTITLNSYLRGQLKLSFWMFVITSFSILILNGLGAAIPSFGFHVGPYLLLGLLAGVTEVIPIVGPIIAFIPAVILGFIDGPITGITVILLYGLIQFFEGNFLVPKIMGDKLDVHPLTVMFALLCGGLMGGIGGMLLALPVAATLKVLFEQYYPEFIQRVENLIIERKKVSDNQDVNVSDSQGE